MFVDRNDPTEENIKKICQLTTDLMEEIAEALRKTTSKAVAQLCWLANEVKMMEWAKKKRPKLYHFATKSKKKRTRKKYINMIRKEYGNDL